MQLKICHQITPTTWGSMTKLRKKLNETLVNISTKPTPAQLGRIKAYYLLMNLYGKKFAEGMGWIQ